MESHGTETQYFFCPTFACVLMMCSVLFCQVEMTPPGTLIVPSASPKDKKLLNAKFKIFMETIDIQHRWRVEMEEAAR